MEQQQPSSTAAASATQDGPQEEEPPAEHKKRRKPSFGGEAAASNSAPPHPPDTAAAAQPAPPHQPPTTTSPPSPQSPLIAATQAAQQTDNTTAATQEDEPSSGSHLRGSRALRLALSRQTAGSSAPPSPAPNQSPAHTVARGPPSTRLKLSKRLLCDLRDLHIAQPAMRIYRDTQPFTIRAFRAHISPTHLARMEELASRSSPIHTVSSPHQLCAASRAHHSASTTLAHRIATLPVAPPTQPPIRALPPHIASGSEKEEEEEEALEEPQPPPDILLP